MRYRHVALSALLSSARISGLVLTLALLVSSQVLAADLFFADFNSGVPPQFSESRTFRLGSKIVALGLFNNKNRKLPGSTSLTLEQLPASKALELTFTLYLVGHWESRGMPLADKFTVHVNDEQLLLVDQFPCKILNNDEDSPVDELGVVTVKDHELGYWSVPVRVEIPAALVAQGAVKIGFSARLTGQGTEFWALDDVRLRTLDSQN